MTNVDAALTRDPGDFERALRFLRTRTNYEQVDRTGAAFGLDPMRALLEGLRHPEAVIPFVHVAGTKGKGSVTWYLDALLRRAGVHTGRYLSPHLQRIEERIALDGTPLSPGAFAAAVLAVEPHVPASGATFFDVLTAAAWVAFAHARVAVAVLETGLGGRLDSTNAGGEKLATVLTSVGLEHVEVLGPDVAAIAREKVAIARAGVPLFAGFAEETEAGRVVSGEAARLGAPVRWRGRDFDVVAIRREGEGLRVDVRVGERRFCGLRLPTLALYQAPNLALAAAVCVELADRGRIAAGPAVLAASFDGEDLRIPGRFEIAGRRPPVVLDGAHTLESLEALFTSIREAFPGRRCVAVAGFSRDKDLDRLSRAFPGAVDLVLATQASSPRAVEPSRIAEALLRARVPCRGVPSPAEALSAALEAAGDGGVVVVTGSFYLVAAAKTILDERTDLD